MDFGFKKIGNSVRRLLNDICLEDLLGRFVFSLRSNVRLIIILASLFTFSSAYSQTVRLNDCEGFFLNVPTFHLATLNNGATAVGSTGTNVGTALTFSYSGALANPAVAAFGGARGLTINTNNATSGNSFYFRSGVIDFSRNCGNAQMVISFWMYRFGTDNNADRLNLHVNTAPNLTGATLLKTVNRSRALAPTVFGLDGWYKYEAVVPTSYTNPVYIILEVIDGSAGATGNIHLDDIQWYDNNGLSGNVTGGVAEAGVNSTICIGGSKQIGSISTPNTTYSWAPAVGLNNSTLSDPIASPAGTTTYTVTSTTTGAGCTTSATDVVTITVSASQAPVLSSVNSTSICSATALSFPFSATNAPTGYIWLAVNNALTTGESYVSTTNSATLNDVIISSINQPVTYSVAAYNASCPASGNPIQSFTANVIGPPSATDPSFTTVCSGGTAVFTTTASGTGPFTYQWQQNNVNIGGATSSTYSYVGVTPAMNGFTYRCIISGACAPSYTTANATLTVPASPTTTAPSNQTICQGANANFSTTAGGGMFPYTYQWQVDNGGGYANIANGGVYSGATTGNLLLTAPPVGMNSYLYRCNVTDACGNLVTSGAAQLFVTAAISYASSTTTQPLTTDVSRCEANAVILQLNININAGTCPSTPSVIGFNVTMNGTSLPVANEVSNVQMYYTGSSNVFLPINQFGPNYAAATNIAISGSQVLSGGNNYFWLVYDVNPLGTGAVIDATLGNLTIVGGNNPGTYIPTVTDPGSGRNITTCPAPGGVINGLTYWLKSNDGSNIQSSTHDAPIGMWASSFSNDNDLSQTNGTKKPQFKNHGYDTTFNFNPYLSFDGTNDILQSPSLLGSGILADDGLALVICATEAIPNNYPAFGYKEGDSGPYYQINPESGMLLYNSAGEICEIDMTDFSEPASDFPMAKVVGISANSSGPDFADFIRNSEQIVSTLSNTAVAEDGLNIGGNGDALRQSNSKIAEVITYNENLNPTDIQRIQTYVGIKYGIHMRKDYLASDATTVVWDYATNAAYNFDIAGIARDDKSGLNQKQSQSVNTDEILTVGLTTIESANATNTESFDSDKSFLLWGNNDEITVSDYSTLAPTATPLLPVGIQGRIKRVWKFQGTNFNAADFNRTTVNQNDEKVMATKTLTLGFDAHTLAGSFVAGPNNTIKVLIDDDGVDWSDAVVVGGAVVVGTTTASGARIVVPNVTVEPHRNYVTLATTDASMLPLASEITHFSAECKTNYNLVKWITATEISVDDFTLQSSTDAVHFYDVYTVAGKGNHSAYNVYTYEHANPQRKNLYYRIKQKTDNGNYVYSRAITTDNSCKVVEDEKLALSIVPNPVVGNINNAELFYSGAQEGKGIVEIKNLLGATLYKLSVEINDELGSINLPTNNLKAGVYIVSLVSGNQNKSVKLVKE